jgi:beta-glucosidase
VRSFPSGFLWGAATAAHQVEGGNVHCDSWALEHAAPSFFAEPSGDAIDQFRLFADDVALLAALGLNSYRFSIEWARIEPEEGRFSNAALSHYRRVIACCRDHGVAPIVTFHHFTTPLWMARQGGWRAEVIVDRFARYCAVATKALGGELASACTINEVNLPEAVAAQGQLRGFAAPEAADRRAAAIAALGVDMSAFFLFAGGDGYAARAARAHQKGRDAIKDAAPALPVGMTMAILEEIAIDDPAARAALGAYQARVYAPFYAAAAGDDFLGVQNYSRSIMHADGRFHRPRDVERTQMGYEYRPQSVAAACRQAWAATKTPLIVTENGVATLDDARRQAFIPAALDGIAAAIDDGVDIRGYLYWSAFDNYEWLAGYRPRFGLIGVDRATQRRQIKPSAVLLGSIARANALGAADAGADTPEGTGAAVGLD